MKKNALGHILATTVDGTSLTGLWAADGTINVFDATSSGIVGAYHPCGALNITIVDGTSFVKHYAANGSWNVISSDEATLGSFHPSGATWMVGVTTERTIQMPGVGAVFETGTQTYQIPGVGAYVETS